MKRKKHLVFLCAIVIIASIATGFFFSNRGHNDMQDMVLLEQGIKITAPEQNIEKYLQAYRSGADSETLEKILSDILLNPECQVKELPNNEK